MERVVIHCLPDNQAIVNAIFKVISVSVNWSNILSWV